MNAKNDIYDSVKTFFGKGTEAGERPRLRDPGEDNESRGHRDCRAIRELPRLRRLYGTGRWRKMKGVARIRTFDGHVRDAEIHWHEAHGVGKRDFKIKEP